MIGVIVTCPECETLYEVARDALGAAGREVKCHKCGHVWVALPDGSRARPSKGTTRAAVKVAAAAVALALIAGGVLYARSGIVSLLPRTAVVYAALGTPVNLRGLEFRNVTVETEIEDGRPVLAVRGEVVNMTDRPIAVPPIRFSMRDKTRLEIYHWVGEAIEGEVAPQGRAAFITRLAAPPIAAEHVEIRFLGRAGGAKGSRT